jgi:hypothetical protein
MIRFKDISIPKPCTVDYDSLPYDEVKRYCSNCQKKVYDFRDKDEEYFNEILSNYGNVCGVYHEDQLKTIKLKNTKPFYFSIFTNIISAFLFFKTLISSYDSHASDFVKTVIIVSEKDSSGITVNVLKNKRKRPYYYSNADIFINNVEYRSGVNVGNIYLPDSVKPTDKIKVVVKKYRINCDTSIKSKTYVFEFGEADKIVIKINHRYIFNIFRKKRVVRTGRYRHD